VSGKEHIQILVELQIKHRETILSRVLSPQSREIIPILSLSDHDRRGDNINAELPHPGSKCISTPASTATEKPPYSLF
jgi:hypothetical protein